MSKCCTKRLNKVTTSTCSTLITACSTLITSACLSWVMFIKRLFDADHQRLFELKSARWKRNWSLWCCACSTPFIRSLQGGEYSENQALTRSLLAVQLSYVDASRMNCMGCLSTETFVWRGVTCHRFARKFQSHIRCP